MKIALTRKLIHAFNVEPEPTYEDDPLHSFHANIYEIEPYVIDDSPLPRQVIVFQNDATRYTVFRVVGESEDKDPNVLKKAFYNTYRESLEQSGFSQDVVDCLAPGEAPLHFVKATDQKRFGQLNAGRNQIYTLNDAFDKDALDQPHLTHLANRSMYVSLDKDPSTEPIRALYYRLRDAFKKPFQFTSYELRFSLALSDDTITRTAIIPSFYTLREVHDTLQTLFYWDHAHMYQFHEDETPGHTFYSDHYGLEFFDPLPNERHARSKTLKSFLQDAQNPYYIYDLGDYWHVQISHMKTIQDDTIMVPRCTGGKLAAPPEDSGGTGGYEALLEILNDPSHPEHGDVKDYLGYASYEPFNKDRINAMLIIHAPVSQINKKDPDYNKWCQTLKKTPYGLLIPDNKE